MVEGRRTYRTAWLAWSIFIVFVGLIATVAVPFLYLGVRDSSLLQEVLGATLTLCLGYAAVASARLRVTADSEGVTRRGLRQRTWSWREIEDLYVQRNPSTGILLLGIVTAGAVGRRRNLGLAALPTAGSEARLALVASELRVRHRAANRTRPIAKDA